ncbi:putative protein Y92H12BR.3 [Dissostichus eleginoides]|uniref:Uncharacterized protein n=1 Tax=Dissostichus eleginoides TaxID=100907 RepID=A0AAD9F717_DISEL|nr:putative protein Y92H12BR.3 [Dissostichus eleginoides]
MESSPQDSASDPGRSGSEPATPLTETTVILELLPGEEHLSPAKKPSSKVTALSLRFLLTPAFILVAPRQGYG